MSDKKFRSLTGAIGVAGAALLLTGCGTAVTSAAGPASTGTSVTIDNCGRTLAFDAEPSAVVGLHPAQTEMLLRLGLTDTLVGQAQATAQALPADVAVLAEGVPVIGSVMPPSREDLLSVTPDFVYSPTEYEFSADQGFASLEQLEAAGATAYVATGGCPERRMSGEVEDLFVDMQNLGEIFGVQDEAAELAEINRTALTEVDTAVSDVDKLRVAQIYYDSGALQAIGAGIEYDILKRAGADSVYAPDQPAFESFFAASITPESLAAEQPDAIVFATYDAAHEQATRDYLAKTFPDMPAVKNGRLIAVSTSDMFPGTIGNVTVVRQIAEALYPDAFGA